MNTPDKATLDEHFTAKQQQTLKLMLEFGDKQGRIAPTILDQKLPGWRKDFTSHVAFGVMASALRMSGKFKQYQKLLGVKGHDQPAEVSELETARATIKAVAHDPKYAKTGKRGGINWPLALTDHPEWRSYFEYANQPPGKFARAHRLLAQMRKTDPHLRQPAKRAARVTHEVVANGSPQTLEVQIEKRAQEMFAKLAGNLCFCPRCGLALQAHFHAAFMGQ